MKKLVSDIVNDTLKKKAEDGRLRWSRTSLTMLTAWVLALLMATINFFQEGFRYDVWLTLVGVATGVKIADSISKKLNK